MPIPDYQSFMLPLLEMADDGAEYSMQQTYENLANYFNLSDEEKKILLPSGKHLTYHNRIHWAKTYLLKAGLLEKTRRGYFVITNEGKKVVDEKPDNMGTQYLTDNYPSFVQFKNSKSTKHEESKSNKNETESSTPEEQLEQAYLNLRDTLSQEVLDTVQNITPDHFERLVVDVLVSMGYGGSRKEAGTALGKSGDEGIDGMIKEDRLGLDVIYVQAKRWISNTVGRPEIQKFAGALQGKRAKKGIFITTSSYSKEAFEYVNTIDSKIILIDGAMLAELMIDHNVGVTTINTFEIKRLDSDYFEE